MDNESPQPLEATRSQPAPEPESESQITTASTDLAAKYAPKHILDDLLLHLNNLILIQICAAFYLDCLSLLLLLRFTSQTQGTNTTILLTNAICILTHLLHSIPQPAPHDFWNHGGVLVDFVGQAPPTRLKLIVFDILIFGLQLLYLTLNYKKATLDPTNTSKTTTTAPAQDLDAEEAGISRADPPATQTESEEGIEMQNLLPLDHERPERATTTTTAQSHAGNTTILRRKDFKQAFMNTARDAPAEESTTSLQRFLERVDQIRARRAAQIVSTAPAT